MKKAKHTPGPWEHRLSMGSVDIIHKNRLIAGVVSNVSIGSNVKKQISDKERTANAKLIAAAPELLEACKKTLCLLRENWDGYDAEEDLEKAIAKAEGK